MDNQIIISKWFRWTYALYLGFIFKFIIDVIFSLIYTNYNLLQPFESYLISIFFTFFVFEVIFLTNKFLNKKFSWNKNPYSRFISQFFLNSLIALVIIEGLRWGMILIIGSNSYISLIDELILIGFIVFVILLYTIIELSIFLINKWRFSLAELERFKKENVEIRFESLRSQLNPHFLFNSLNTLSSLIYENQDNASLFVRELSDVYRYILENRDKELIQINKELDFASSFINLLQLRFEKNLQVVSNTQNVNKEYRVAPLSLQLLIENAVKHNIISKKYPLIISIFIDEDMLVVKNNLQPKPSKEFSNEMGLKNIKSRYEYLTDRKIDILKTNTEFIVRIPLI